MISFVACLNPQFEVAQSQKLCTAETLCCMRSLQERVLHLDTSANVQTSNTLISITLGSNNIFHIYYQENEANCRCLQKSE